MGSGVGLPLTSSGTLGKSINLPRSWFLIYKIKGLIEIDPVVEGFVPFGVTAVGYHPCLGRAGGRCVQPQLHVAVCFGHCRWDGEGSSASSSYGWKGCLEETGAGWEGAEEAARIAGWGGERCGRAHVLDSVSTSYTSHSTEWRSCCSQFKRSCHSAEH